MSIKVSMSLLIGLIVAVNSSIALSAAAPEIQADTTISVSNPDLPYVQVCCLQNAFYEKSYGMYFGLPITVTLYDENMNTLSNKKVNALLELISPDGNTTIYNITKKTNSNGLTKFGFQIHWNYLYKTFYSQCNEREISCKPVPYSLVSNEYFLLTITGYYNNKVHKYYRAFTFGTN